MTSTNRALGIVGRLAAPSAHPSREPAPRSEDTIPDSPDAWFGGTGAPTKIGSYRLLRKISTDDTTATFLAHHDDLGHRAAVTILHADRATDERMIDRLCTEAIVATRARHSGIARVLDYGQHEDGSVYLIREHLEGETLAARLASRGRLPERTVAAIGAEIAEAMGVAHAAGIVHRSLTTENVFLVRATHVPHAEHVKLLDFSVAKVGDRGSAAFPAERGPRNGAAGYVSPEQRRDPDAVDGRTDIYALGCILFEMLCGRSPFAEPVASAAAGLSPTLERLVASMLAAEPAQRPPTMAAIASALSRIAQAAPESSPRRRIAHGSCSDVAHPVARRLPLPAPSEPTTLRRDFVRPSLPAGVRSNKRS